MSFVTTAPIIAGLALLAYVLISPSRGKPDWLWPALLAPVFLTFSSVAILREGPTGFWPVHTANLWGNQVWFDLLLAAGIGWTLILPRARGAGMALRPWGVLVVATGSIGFLAMLARLLWLEHRA